jgi:hypothetical protein
MQTVSFWDERGIGQGSPQAFILGSQAFALSRNPRQLFSETLELPPQPDYCACKPSMRVQGGYKSRDIAFEAVREAIRSGPGRF